MNGISDECLSWNRDTVGIVEIPFRKLFFCTFILNVHLFNNNNKNNNNNNTNNWPNTTQIHWPLLVALTYAEERLFKPDVLSSPPSICKTRDNDTIVRKHSKIFVSDFAEHSITLTLCGRNGARERKKSERWGIENLLLGKSYIQFSTSLPLIFANSTDLNFGSSQKTHSETSSIWTSRWVDAKSNLLPATTIGISWMKNIGK